MCFLITFAVPESSAATVSSARLPRVAPHENPSIQHLIGPGFTLFSIRDGGCSCSLYSLPDEGTGGLNRSERRARTLRQKYARLGWSETKIARALADASQAHEQKDTKAGIRADVAAYLADLADGAGPVKLIVHHFHGSFVEEAVTPAGRAELSAADLRDTTKAVHEDVVYTIHRLA